MSAMQKTVNGAAGDFIQKSMFMFDPAINSSINPATTIAAAKFTTATPPNFFGFIQSADLASNVAHCPPLIPAYIAAQHQYPIPYIQEEPAQLRKLFIGGLNHETTDDQLKEYYSQWGNVVDCIVIRDPATKHSRGFGFVTYATIKMAEQAMDARPHTINGKVVDPKRAIPREHMLPLTPNNPPHFLETEPAAGCKLTLSGIHWDYHTVDGFRQYFEKFGEVEQVEIVGHPRGYGFIVFEERASAERCLQAGKQHSVNGKKVEVKECASATELPSTSVQSGKRQFTNRAQNRGSPDQRTNSAYFNSRPNTNVKSSARPFIPRNDNEPLSINDFPHLN
ncbi:RNA recognition motif domain and Nucleotide-binding, alpha-beta plait domain-containing protein [Aphelenchoides besseyi]|nr:RNA recognition motif domain and Nucleotide-binding, alpha-beta plait domain-containing protein [Aphelenchoides besseyi]KAI6202344.1 RNA recognition motif domain and Nucleotide-binding, alpha-beta plait domain-containing protein [Aphelenchoides besseyi]